VLLEIGGLAFGLTSLQNFFALDFVKANLEKNGLAG
jgi:hypothetical protein